MLSYLMGKKEHRLVMKIKQQKLKLLKLLVLSAEHKLKLEGIPLPDDDEVLLSDDSDESMEISTYLNSLIILIIKFD